MAVHPIHAAEFYRIVNAELTSPDPDIKRIGTERLYVLMTGEAAPDEATAATAVKEICQSILTALA